MPAARIRALEAKRRVAGDGHCVLRQQIGERVSRLEAAVHERCVAAERRRQRPELLQDACNRVIRARGHGTLRTVGLPMLASRADSRSVAAAMKASDVLEGRRPVSFAAPRIVLAGG